MRQFFIGFLLALFTLPALAFLYLKLGLAPVVATDSPLPFEKQLAVMALNARVVKEAPKQAALAATEDNLMAGAKLYHDNCAVCHGMGTQAKTAIAKGMYPPPPELMQGIGVTDDPVGETYWKVANGIRLTGMPAFRDSLSDQQRWQVSQFVATANKLPASVTALIATLPPVQ
jgi:mono/diheme cytochrome c family protein